MKTTDATVYLIGLSHSVDRLMGKQTRTKCQVKVLGQLKADDHFSRMTKKRLLSNQMGTHPAMPLSQKQRRADLNVRYTGISRKLIFT